jgi:zinc/manganese transport system permease protein
VPAVCANYLTPSLRVGLAIGWVVATASSIGGLYASYRFDVPTGAAVVCVLGVALLLTVVVTWLRPPEPQHCGGRARQSAP